MKNKNALIRLRAHGLGSLALAVTFAAVALPSNLLATAQASASAVIRSQDSIVEPTGGMVGASSRYTSVWTQRVAPAKTPSCHRITYKGNAGAIHVQTGKSGYLQWGIYMYNSKLNHGPWVASVYVNKKKVDGKKQDYPPHSSLPPSKAKKGGILHITAHHHADANGKNYGSVPNKCVIP
jgi:hypothetical protein